MRHIITFPEERWFYRPKILHVYYGTNESIKGVDMQFEKNKITALIGPSGSGKSTYLRSLNRMNDTIDIARVTGEIWYEGIDVNRPDINVYEMRKHIGMVFQRPNLFAKSIYKNITFPHERWGERQEDLGRMVETSLKQAALMGSGQDDLHKSALTLSGGQQQRLCIARAISVEARYLTHGWASFSAWSDRNSAIRRNHAELKKNYTIVIVTHSMQQAARASDYTGFFYLETSSSTIRLRIFSKMRNCNRPTIMYRVTLDKVKWQQKENRMTEPILQVKDLSVY